MSAQQNQFNDLLDGLEGSLFDADPFSSPTKPAPQQQQAPCSSPRGPPVPRNSTPSKISQKNPNIYQTPSKKKQKVKHVAIGPSSPPPQKPTTTAAAADKENIAELLGGLDDWDDSALDLLSSPSSNNKSAGIDQPQPAKRVPISRQYLRFAVVHVEEGSHPTNRKPCKIVRVTPDGPSSSKQSERLVYLQDDWLQLSLKPDDIVNIVGDVDHKEDIDLCLSNNRQFLIHHPDTLITATAIATSMPCPRKPLLQDRLRATSPTTEPLLYGNLLHELFQTCLVNNEWSAEFRSQQARALCAQQSTIAAAWELNKPMSELHAQLMERSAAWPSWAHSYLSQAPKPTGLLADPRSQGATDQSGKACVSKVHDIEEDIWSPRLGMKGKIDVSVQARVVGKLALPQERAAAGVVAPFEIKTGRTIGVMEHRAQTMLYTLLMADRYDQDVTTGLLFYTQQEQLISVAQAKHELRGLVHARNELARYASMRSDWSLSRAKNKERSEESGDFAELVAKDAATDEQPQDIEDALLPVPVDDDHWCKRCYANDACMLYRKTIDPQPFGTAQPSEAMVDLYQQKTAHVTQAQGDFFREWEHLINLEERELVRYRKEMWTMGPEERQSIGRCLADMAIDLSFKAQEAHVPTGAAHIHRFTYRFVRSSQTRSQASQKAYESSLSLLGGLIATGDPIVVSMSDPEILSLARGFVLDLKPDSIVLGLDHELQGLACAERPDSPPAAMQSFRIDKDELASGMGRTRDNLAQLFYAEGDHKRKQLIVDLAPPFFAPTHSDYVSTEEQSLNLNSDQRAAIDKVLSAQDYACVLGMPGTGKTTTVAEIISALVGRGKSVLLASYTHSAVDNILLKLKDKAIDMLRLGNPDKILPALHKFTLAEGGPIASVDDLEHRFMTPKVVATTALSINHPIFMRRHFDYCIVDEASQITLPACLGPLRFADTFVLVGDHNQLPPLVKNTTARRSGLEVSLFKRLCEARPESMVYLSYQYRMNRDVMSLSNKLVYDGLMKGGSEAVLSRSLRLHGAQKALESLHARGQCADGCWMQPLLDSRRSVIFMDTDKMEAQEDRQGHLIVNHVEGELVSQAVRAFLAAGLPADEIGVITLYRQQIKLLSSMLQDEPAVEVLTADRSQGRDKECIVMSLTRSNDENKVGDLLRDWRRLNVCLTRARSKLVIFGSRSTLSEELKDLFDLLQAKDMFFNLHRDALSRHHHIPRSPRGQGKGKRGGAQLERTSSPVPSGA